MYKAFDLKCLKIINFNVRNRLTLFFRNFISNKNIVKKMSSVRYYFKSILDLRKYKKYEITKKS